MTWKIQQSPLPSKYQLSIPLWWQPLGFGLLLSAVCTAAPSVSPSAKPWLAAAQIAQHREDSGDLASAEPIWREALRSAEAALDPGDPQIAALLSHVAGILHLEGRDREAYPLATRAVAIAEAAGDTRLIGFTLTHVGLVLTGEGEFARAEPVLRRSLALVEQSAGAEALDTAIARNNLATLYSDTGRYAAAEQLQRLALPVYEKYLGPDAPAFATALANMFTILSSQRRAEEGEPYLRRALAIAEKKYPGTAAMAHLQVCLAALEYSRGRFLQARSILEAAIALEERTLGANHPEVARSLVCYSAVMKSLRRKSEARQAASRARLILQRNSFTRE